jgi:GNAT superfamily N-acetyltransferase
MKMTADFHEEHTLADGAHVTLRAIRPDDAEALRTAFRRLSSTTRHERFVLPPLELSQETLRYLTNVDQRDHVAIVATEPSLDLKSERGLGVARFIRDPADPTRAEAAVVVIDEAQRRGIGKLLLTTLASCARDHGVKTFWAETAASNERMRAILREAGASIRHDDGDTIRYDVTLSAERIAAGQTALVHVFYGAASWLASRARAK